MDVRANTMKFLEENIRGKPYNIGFGNDFLDMTLKAQAKKEKKKRNLTSKWKTFVHQRTLAQWKGMGEHICNSYNW